MTRHKSYNHVLKIFSGPHVGAEVILSNGEHVIGSSDDCDVILHDQLIAPRHARVLVSEERVQCDSLDGAPLLLEGKQQDTVVLAPFQYFTLGNTHMAIGSADEPWPAMQFPDFTLRQASVSSERSQEAATESPQSKDSNTHLLLPSQTLRLLCWLAAAVIVLTTTVAAGYHVFATHDNSVGVSSKNEKQIERDLAMIAKECAPDGIIDIRREKGRFSVCGYVDNAEQQRRLRRCLSGACPDVHLRLWNSDRLVQSVAEVLHVNGLSLNVAKGKPGEVVLRGAVADGKLWDHTLEQLRRDIPTIRQLTLLVKVSEVAPQNSPSSKPVLAGGFTGKGSAQEVSLKDGAVSHDVRAVCVGTYAWIVRRDGCHVFPGGVFEGGIVKAIRPEGIVLSRAGKDKIQTQEGEK